MVLNLFGAEIVWMPNYLNGAESSGNPGGPRNAGLCSDNRLEIHNQCWKTALIQTTERENE